MPEPDLIQRQRDILAGFRQATAERARAEADAEARRQREREAADAALKKVQQEAETQRAKTLADAEARRKADRAAAEKVLSQARRTGDAAVAETRQALSETWDSLARGGLRDLVSTEARPTAPQPGADPASQLSQAVAVAAGARKDVRDKVAELLRWREAAATRRNGLIVLVIVGASVIGLLAVRSIQRTAEVARQTAAATAEVARQTAAATAEVARQTAAATAEVARQTAAATAEVARQTATATELLASFPTRVREADGAVMVRVPAGGFLIGSADSDSQASRDEKPQHQVALDEFWIDRTEVTNAQYRKFVDAGGYNNQAYWTEAGWAWKEQNKVTQPYCWGDGNLNQAQQPVVCVSWYEAYAYARWAGGRLPTEAEWEKAARGSLTGSGDGRIYPWGNDAPDCDRSNYAGCVGRPAVVGSYVNGVSPYGALDLAGNVWEWVSSKYGSYPYRRDDGREDQSSTEARVLRGGSWNNVARNVRSTYRDRLDPGYRYNLVGFRVASSGL